MEQKRYNNCVLKLLYCAHFGLTYFVYCVGFVFNLHVQINPEGSRQCLAEGHFCTPWSAQHFPVTSVILYVVIENILYMLVNIAVE